MICFWVVCQTSVAGMQLLLCTPDYALSDMLRLCSTSAFGLFLGGVEYFLNHQGWKMPSFWV
jgi:hypothetical protein